MSDNTSDTISPYNDDTIIVRPEIFRANSVTGDDETVVLTGRSDGVAFLSLDRSTKTATAIAAGVSVALTEVGVTGTYTATMEGSEKATALDTLPNGAKLYRHVQFGSDYRRAIPVTLKKDRDA